jgi:uncharacterized protein
MLEQMERQASRRQTRRGPGLRRWLWRLILLPLLIYGFGSILLSFSLLASPSRRKAVPEGDPGRYRGSEGQPSIEQVLVKFSLGHRLPVWVAEPKSEPQGCVLLFHGRGGAHSVARMQFVQSRGYAVLAPDFRAHGQAPDALSGFGYLEQEEVRVTLALARRLWPQTKIVAWGHSMGAAAIVFAAEDTASLAGVILESTYSTLTRAFQNRFEHHLPDWMFPLAYGPMFMAQIRSGLWLEDIQPIQEIKQFEPARVLFVHGEMDWRVQRSEHEAFLAALPGAEGLVLPGIGHTDFFSAGGESYRKRIESQFEKWMRD